MYLCSESQTMHSVLSRISSAFAMLEIHLQFSVTLLLCLIPLLYLLFLFNLKHAFKDLVNSITPNFPRSYPILIVPFSSLVANKDSQIQWMSDVLRTAPNFTFTLQLPFGHRFILTANPAVVQHMLKTNFHIYQKGCAIMSDFMGDGIFNTNGQSWKFQRQVSSHAFNTNSLRKFVEDVVETELSQLLIPILASVASAGTVLDLQDILQRFAFDNICIIAFGYDPAYLLPSLPNTQFALAFEDAARLSSERFNSPIWLIWKMKRFFNIGSERQLKDAVKIVRQYASHIVKEKKQGLKKRSSIDSVDILSRFLSSGVSDEDFVTDVVISFILAGRDTTSAALTWFFWLLSSHPEVEKNILMEIREKSEAPVYEELKDMVYTHASLCESMRLYPPVPLDIKAPVANDVLPDGTVVKKGDRVGYHPYAMGRIEEVWGSDWEEFRPERWLEREEGEDKWKFVARDAYTYPVFQAGPRICLGKEMAFLQMKAVVAGVLRQFRVVSAIEPGVEPAYMSTMTAKMKGGFPVRIEERV